MHFARIFFQRHTSTAGWQGGQPLGCPAAAMPCRQQRFSRRFPLRAVSNRIEHPGISMNSGFGMVFSRIPWIPLICGERHAKIVHPVSRKYSLKKPARFVVQRPGKHEPIQPGIRMFSWSDRSTSEKTYKSRPGQHTKIQGFVQKPGFPIRLETALRV